MRGVLFEHKLHHSQVSPHGHPARDEKKTPLCCEANVFLQPRKDGVSHLHCLKRDGQNVQVQKWTVAVACVDETVYVLSTMHEH